LTAALVFAAAWPTFLVWLVYIAGFRRELRERRRLLGEE